MRLGGSYSISKVLLDASPYAVGNRRFRILIDSHLDNYIKVKSRQKKSEIVTNIVESIKKSAGSAIGGAGFVRKVSFQCESSSSQNFWLGIPLVWTNTTQHPVHNLFFVHRIC